MPQRKAGPIPEAAKLERQEQENTVQHRALLLYVMQDEGRRSVRLAASAVGRVESSLRPWRKRLEWDRRIAQEGASAQARAVQLYREFYYRDQQLREVAVVEPNMRIAFLATSPPPNASTGLGEGARAVLQRGEDDRELGIDSPAKKELDAIKRHVSLVDALLGRFARKLVSDKNETIVPNVRDVLLLMKARRELGELLGDIVPTGAAGGGATLEPSARVVEARRAGTSELVAMREDADELLTVLRALEGSAEIDREFDGVAKGPARLRAVEGESEEEAVFNEEAG